MNPLAQIPQNAAAFIVLEAAVAWYAVNPDGSPGSAVLFGGIVDKLAIADSFKERVFDVPGAKYGQVFHEDESHEIEIGNIRMWEEMGGAQVSIPAIVRNQSLYLVIVWEDADSGAWNKRVYLNATAPKQSIPGDGSQAIRFVAQSFIETAGAIATGAPDLTAGDLGDGQVWYVTSGLAGAVRTLLYTYSSGSRLMTAVASSGVLAATALITVTSSEMNIAFSGVIALSAAMAAGVADVTVDKITALGATYSADTTSARIEFWQGGARVATLTALGELVVVDLTEQASEQAAGIEGIDGNVDWLFTLDGGGGFAPRFTEGVPA